PAGPAAARPSDRARLRVPHLRDAHRPPAGPGRLRARGPLSDRRMPQCPVTARRVAVVLPTWNGRRWIDRCLGSLRATAYPLSATFVVDNGSRDGTADAVASGFPQVVLIRHRRNLGFAEGANVGVRAALRCGAEFVAVVNQDTWADPKWLTPLVRAAAADPAIGIVTPVQYDYEGRTVEPAQAGLVAAAGSREFIETPQVIRAVLP